MGDFLNEAFLKLVSLVIRFVQLALSIVVVGGAAQLIADAIDRDIDTPGQYVAAVAIGCITALWSGIALLLTCCAGEILLVLETSLDVICLLLSLTTVILLRSDALSSRSEFQSKMGGGSQQSISNIQSLIRMAFAISIILM